MVAVYILIALVGAAFFYILGWATCSMSLRGRVEAALESVKEAREQTKDLRDLVKDEDRYARLSDRMTTVLEANGKILTGYAAKLESVNTQVMTVFNAMKAIGALDPARSLRPNMRQRGEPKESAPPLDHGEDDEPIPSMIR
jgi:hypothetical protein